MVTVKPCIDVLFVYLFPRCDVSSGRDAARVTASLQQGGHDGDAGAYRVRTAHFADVHSLGSSSDAMHVWHSSHFTAAQRSGEQC